MDADTVSAMQVSTYSDDAILHTVRLWRDEPLTESDADTLSEQLGAMSTFAFTWMEPLAIAIGIRCFDPQRDHSIHGAPRPPDVPDWHLRASGAPEAVDTLPTINGSRVEEHASLDATTIAEAVRRAIAQPCKDNGCVAQLESIVWTACSVKLPEPGASRFVIDDRAGRVTEVPIEVRNDSMWVSGPRRDAITGPPLRVGFTEGELRIDVIWDLWHRGPGRAALDAAVARVVARGTGWYVVD